MKNQKILLSIIFLIAISLTGCWDRIETEEILLVDAIAFDIVTIDNTQQFQITFLSTKPNAGGAEGQMGMAEEGGLQQVAQQWIASTYGPTLEEAINRFTMRSPRYLHLDHNIIIFIGENLARNGVAEVLDFIVRNKGIRLRNHMIVTMGNTVANLLAIPEFEQTLAIELFEILERGSREGDYVHKYDVNNFIQDVLTIGKDPCAPIFAAFLAKEEERPELSPKIEGKALFHADRMVGTFNKEETKGYLILAEHATRGTFFIDHNGKRASFVYDGLKVRRRLSIKNHEIHIDYDVTLKGEITEVFGFITDFTEGELHKLEELLAKEVKDTLLKTISKIQEVGSDVLGIGRFIHAKHPSIWRQHREDWQETFQNLTINVKVEVEIVGTETGLKRITPKR